MFIAHIDPFTSEPLAALNRAPRILEAATNEFDEHGFTDASISRIATRAETSRSLVSYYFPTKSSLAQAIINLAYPNGVFMGDVRQANNPLDAIILAADHVSGSVAHSSLARVVIKLRQWREVALEGAPARYSGWLARVADYLEEAIRAELVPRSTNVPLQTRLLVGGVAGLIDMAITTGDYLNLVEDSVTFTQERIECLHSA